MKFKGDNEDSWLLVKSQFWKVIDGSRLLASCEESILEALGVLCRVSFRGD